MIEILKRGWFVRSLAVAATMLTLSACNSDDGDDSPDFDYGDNDVGTVLCLGDSITEGECAAAGAPYPSRLAGLSGKRTINQGACGEKSDGGASRAGSLLNRFSPGTICVLYGANDALFGYSTDFVIGNLRSIIGQAKANKTRVLLATCLPTYDSHAFADGQIKKYNDAIRNLAKEEGVTLVDLGKEFGSDRSLMQADGLHPSDSGTQLMALAFNDEL